MELKSNTMGGRWWMRGLCSMATSGQDDARTHLGVAWGCCCHVVLVECGLLLLPTSLLLHVRHGQGVRHRRSVPLLKSGVIG